MKLLKKISSISPEDIKNIKQSIKYISKYKKYYFITVGLILIALGFNLLQPYYFGQLIDVLTGNSDGETWKLVFWVFFLYFSYSICSLGETFLTLYINNSIIRDIKEAMYKKLVFLPMKAFDKMQVGEFMNRIEGDVGSLSNILVKRSLSVVVDVVRIIGIGYFLFKLNFNLTVILLVTFPISLIIFGLFGNILKKINSILKNEIDSYYSFLNESIAGIKEIKALGCQDFIKRKLYKFNKNIINLNIKAGKTDAMAIFSNMMIGGMGLCLVVLLGSYQIINGEFTLGNFVAFYTYAGQFYNAMRNITQLNSTIQSSLVSMSRIYHLLNNFSIPVLKSGNQLPEKHNGEIRFENVSFSYDGKRNILDNFSLTIPPNTVIALVGSNGSGKTTLLNLILRFYEPQKGAIYYDGKNIKEFNINYWRKKVNILLQQPFIFKGTIKENLELACPGVKMDEIIECCEKVQLHSFINKLPQKYNTIIGGEDLQLSLGQKQRLAIARSLLTKADIFLFDEISASLDGESDEFISNIIRELAREHTVVLVTHRLSTIQIANKIVVLEEGKVKEAGTLQELLASGRIYKRLFKGQYNTLRRYKIL